MASFVLQLPLQTQPYQEDILNKRFEIARQMHNALLNVTLKRYQELIKTKKYRNLVAQITGKKVKDKPIWNEIKELRKEARLSEYDFQADIKPMQHHFSNNIDSHVAQKIAKHVWTSYQKKLFGNGKKIHFKKYDSLHSVEGKTNQTGIRYVSETVLWKGLRIPVCVDHKNEYEMQAIRMDISYCRIVRHFVRGHYKYYVQLVIDGIPPIKYTKQGEVKHPLGSGDVGLDIGTSTLAIVSEKQVRLLELADRTQNIEKKQRLLLRKLDRSRRETNPENFQADGTLKKQGNKKLKWNRSNRYKKTLAMLKELQRKQAAIRKMQHECLANEILSYGDQIFVETMQFSALAKRAKKTEKNDKGKFKRKKRFGKSIANRAPAMLLSIIDRKLQYQEKELHRIDTWSAKASQYNHETDTYQKKKLSQRWNLIDEKQVQRDLYSAFLIQNVRKDLKGFHKKKCKSRYPNFLKLHDLEVQRLMGQKNLSSMGI